MLKTRNHLRKLEKMLKHKKLKKLRKLCKDNSNWYYVCLIRFDSHDECFDFKHYLKLITLHYIKFSNSFVPEFENFHCLVHLNDNENSTLVDSYSDQEIITGFYNEEVLDKQSLTGCDHSESHLSQEGKDVFTLNGRIKGKLIRMLLICLSGNLLRQKSHQMDSKSSKDSNLLLSNHINNAKLKRRTTECYV